MNDSNDYLTQLRQDLNRKYDTLEPAKRDEILAEIESHIEEGLEDLRMGSLASRERNVLAELGSPTEMADGLHNASKLTQSPFLSPSLRLTSTLLAIGLLLFSWMALYVSLMAFTEGWGAPWDTARIRPPVGHWQRTLNDFFESGIGAYLPASIFFSLHWLLYSYKVRIEELHLVSWVFAVTNIVAAIALFIVVMSAQGFIPDVPAHLTPDDWAYWGDFRREWPVSLAALLWFIGVVLLQPKLVDIVSEKIRWAS